MSANGWKKVTLGAASDLNAAFLKPSEMKKGQTIQGTFLGSYTDQFDRLAHRIQVSEDSVIIINGTGQLNALLAQVNPGTEVRITYKGKVQISSGKNRGKSAHTFEVEARA